MSETDINVEQPAPLPREAGASSVGNSGNGHSDGAVGGALPFTAIGVASSLVVRYFSSADDGCH